MKYLHYIPLSLLSAMMLFSSINYFTQVDTFLAAYASLGFPAWTMYTNGILKIAGVCALAVPHIPLWLKRQAFTGFFFILLYGLIAHLVMNDGRHAGALIGLVLWVLTAITQKKLVF